MEENATPSSKESTKKGKKGRKNKDVDWEDDVAKELEDLKLEEAGEKRSESPEPVPEKKEKKKEKVGLNCPFAVKFVNSVFVCVYV